MFLVGNFLLTSSETSAVGCVIYLKTRQRKQYNEVQQVDAAGICDVNKVNVTSVLLYKCSRSIKLVWFCSCGIPCVTLCTIGLLLCSCLIVMWMK